ncbi:MAG TPA: hypothetical protein VFU93_07415 [Acidimicrobiales bacterium]|nr:hypothetical protein [Acidimicrobiales bacterium]
MDRTTYRIALAGAALVALTLAACGDDDDDAAETATTAVDTEADATSYTSAGNELCDRTKGDIEAAFPDFEGEPTLEQAQQLGADLGAAMQRWRDGVAELDPPSDLADDHDALVAALDGSIEKLEAAASSEEGAQAMLDAGGPPLDEPATLAHALFDRCPVG